jgi:intracellular sulfur oxidation DsrE/DsrF family protein
VVVILHGSEATSFTSAGYARNRMLVDQAARLSAYRLIEVRMCETWMEENEVAADDIPAFVETVPYAPEEIERLEAKGYVPAGDLRI